MEKAVASVLGGKILRGGTTQVPEIKRQGKLMGITELW